MSLRSTLLDSTDSADFEERYAQLSERLASHVAGTAKSNIFTFEGILAETYERGGYTGGWIALRDWAEKQPWLEEAKRTAAIPTLGALGRLDLSDNRSGEIEPDGSPSLGAVAHVLRILRIKIWLGVPDAEREHLNASVTWLQKELSDAIDSKSRPKSDSRWLAIRDWGRAQLPEATPEDHDDADAALSLAEQGRMLGMLRVHRMRAVSDTERAEIDARIAKLEADFEASNLA